MLTFALVAGPSVPHRIRAALAQAEPPDLPFRATQHLLWSNDTATVHFAGWQDDVDLGIGSRWDVTDGGMTAFTGHVWPRRGAWSSGQTWAAQLAAFLERHDLSRGSEELLGIFTAVSLDASGTGIVASDALSTSLVYWVEAGETTILSSRVDVAARLASEGEPRRDHLGVGWLAYCGHAVAHHTGYEGVEVVPFGSVAEVSPRGISFRSTTPPWRAPRFDDRDAALDDVRAGMVASIEAALAYPVDRRVAELTGGKDSRLILALLVAEGLTDEFVFQTWGRDDLPDVVTAKRLAKTFRLRHETGHDLSRQQRAGRRRERLLADHPGVPLRELQLRANVGTWAGMRLAWQLETAAPPQGDRVGLNGMYGESLTTNYPFSTQLRTHAELRQMFLMDMKHGTAGVLKPEALEWFRTEWMTAAYQGFSTDDAPQDVVDAFYLRSRLRRWFGMTQEADELMRLFPLHSPLGVRLAFSIGVRERHAQWPYRELYQRTCASLAEEPFTSGGWPTALAPDRLPEPKVPPPLRSPTSVRSTATNAALAVRGRAEKEDVAVIRRHVLDDPSNPVFEVVDRSAVERAVGDFDLLSEPHKLQLYGVLTAAIWLGGREITLSPV